MKLKHVVWIVGVLTGMYCLGKALDDDSNIAEIVIFLLAAGFVFVAVFLLEEKNKEK